MGLNDDAWQQIFDEQNILERVSDGGIFQIGAAQIRKYREPRLMAKFDHSINLPTIFKKNKLAILPVSRSEYVIAPFKNYHDFETPESTVLRATVPSFIESIGNEITSEAVALNAAFASGIIDSFVQDEVLLTVSGRMGSGSFDFEIGNVLTGANESLTVNNSQIEIDAGFEGRYGLALVEAKLSLSDDFLVRQLYYPFRTWQTRVSKPVRPVFLVYSNGIFRLYEYLFADPNNYSSIELINFKQYALTDKQVSFKDVVDLAKDTSLTAEPLVPFPQADSLERVINLSELVLKRTLTKEEITENYAFDKRQADYYSQAANYLGLVTIDGSNVSASALAHKIFQLPYQERQLNLAKLVLSHEVFARVFERFLQTGQMPTREETVTIMRASNLYRVDSESTYRRRASTVRAWTLWVINLGVAPL